MKILILCLFLGLSFSCSRDGGDGNSSENNSSPSDPSDGNGDGNSDGNGDGNGDGSGDGDDTSDLPINTVLQFGASSAPVSTVPMGAVMTDKCWAIASDATAIYCAGETEGHLFDFNDGNTDSTIVKISKDSGEIQWSFQLGKNTSERLGLNDGRDSCYTIAVDETGVYCGGFVTGSVGELGGGSEDAVVIKLSVNDGSLEWIKQIGSESELAESAASSADYCKSIALYGDNVYCGGNSFSSLVEENAGGHDMFIFKLSKSTGELGWLKHIGAQTQATSALINDISENEYVESIAVDETGIYLGGYTYSDLGEANGGLTDIFLMKLTEGESSADIDWLNHLGDASDDASSIILGDGTSSTDQCKSIALYGDGVYCGGHTKKSFAETTGGKFDVLVVKLDKSSGALEWAKQIGETESLSSSSPVNLSNQNEYCYALAVNDSGIYCTGHTGSDLVEVNSGGNDIFVAKFSEVEESSSVTVTLDWVKHIGDSSESVDGAAGVSEDAYALAVDTSGIYVAGGTNGDLGEENAGLVDQYVMKLDPSDQRVLWTTQLGKETYVTHSASHISSATSDECNTVVTDDDYIYCGGKTRGSLGAENAGDYDLFVMKIKKSDYSIEWTKQIGSEPVGSGAYPLFDEGCSSLALNGDSVFCSGNTTGSLFEENGGGEDIFVVRLSKSSGEKIWGTQIGAVTELSEDASNRADSCNGLAADENFVYCAGYTKGNLGEANHNTKKDIILGKFQVSDGALSFIKQLGSVSELSENTSNQKDECLDLAIDDTGIYCVGYTEGSLFGTHAGNSDIFAIKFDFDGQIVWGSQLGQEVSGTDSTDSCNSIAIDEEVIYCAGYTTGNLGGSNDGSDSSNALVVKFSKVNGALQYASQLDQQKASSTESVIYGDECFGVAVDVGSVYCAGKTYSPLGESTSASQFSSSDAFILKLKKADGTLESIKQLGNVSERSEGAASGQEFCEDLALDSSGLFCVGTTTGDLGELNGGSTDAFIWRVSP